MSHERYVQRGIDQGGGKDLLEIDFLPADPKAWAGKRQPGMGRIPAGGGQNRNVTVVAPPLGDIRQQVDDQMRRRMEEQHRLEFGDDSKMEELMDETASSKPPYRLVRELKGKPKNPYRTWRSETGRTTYGYVFHEGKWWKAIIGTTDVDKFR